jgi:macrodomain Ter protein organizer (MatP/YcbG family)
MSSMPTTRRYRPSVVNSRAMRLIRTHRNGENIRAIRERRAMGLSLREAMAVLAVEARHAERWINAHLTLPQVKYL